jgi:hypothetical protein
MKPKNSSTSNSEWKQFSVLLLATAALSLLLTYVSVYLIDPYDMFLYSPDITRKPVAKMPRHWKPGIARKSDFDSILIGTSSIMLLKPERLNPKLDARIANLALPAASPWEQLQIFELFRQHHASLNLIVIGVDQAWCSTDGADQYLDVGDRELAEGRKLKEWLYASDFLGQLPPLNARLVDESIRQVKSLLGIKDYGNGNDGYYDFTVRYKERYSPQRIQENLYGKPPRKPPKAENIAPNVIKNWAFPDIEKLRLALESLAQSTRKILVFPPYHHFSPYLAGSRNKARWAECKRRVARIGDSVANVTVVDFLFESAITLNDGNYWDSTHYKVEIANQLEDILGEVMANPTLGDDAGHANEYKLYRILSGD